MAHDVHALFLSPHLDDVALSCAGMVRAHLARGERPLIATVFAGPPPADLPLVSLHRDLQHDLADRPQTVAELRALWERRRAEDAAAMAILGVEYVHLPVPDAVFRPETQRWSHVWRASAATLRAVVATITPQVGALWRSRGRPRIYAPLAVGGHVDHEACFGLARALAAEGADVAHYEDLPYALRDGLLDARIAALGGTPAPTVVDTRPHLDVHVAAARCYASQLTGMLGDPARIAPLLERVVTERGGERLWRFP